MQTISLNHSQTERSVQFQTTSISKWLNKTLAVAEENRFGVTAILILLQVSIAGFNVVIPPMIGASVLLMAPGISLAFLSNSIALAQAKMKWVLLGFALSMIVNATISIYCFSKLL
ncbi:hypothetical protein [Segetibacter aerophilus]|uniref:Uncharacterized protein n=1 Tax=Segetibacter aerophilus TaxID=670293 RepID=A0A512BFZ6_9BACT|nr:hypothetical protein [Segetibacter aerophilus]GEO10883.1 hypothetical protein SAE01_33790 [Segetibacter aerophilus]